MLEMLCKNGATPNLLAEAEPGDYLTAPMLTIRPLKAQERNYLTIPVPAVRPLVDDDEVYTDFETAISDRLLMVQSTLSRALHVQAMRDATSALRPAVVGTKKNWLSWPVLSQSWMRRVRTVAFAILCILIGFDLMGLLVLLSR
jgi:hypothetical protein